MANNSNHHYVPKFYFRNFSEDGRRISVLLRSSGRVIPNATIKGQASKKNFYGDVEVERTLAVLEKSFSEAVRHFRRNSNFEEAPNELYAYLIGSALTQKVRTLTDRRIRKAAGDRMYQLWAELKISNRRDLTDIQRADALRLITTLEADEYQDQIIALKVVSQAIPELLDMSPVMLLNKTKRPFVFCDAPVVLTNPHLSKVKWTGVLGFRTAGLIMFYPLDSKRCMMLIDKGCYRVRKLKRTTLAVREIDDVSALNKLQIHNATNAVYFCGAQHSDYLGSIWRQERERLTTHEGKVVEAPGYYEDGERLGDIVHFYDEQLNYVPKLSFLSYAEGTEVKYRLTNPYI